MNDRVLKPIKSLSLSAGEALPYNCYVSVGSRFVLYRRKGDVLETQTVEKFKKKSSQSLFVSIDDYNIYLKNLQKIFMPVWTDPELKPQDVHDAFCKLIEEFLMSPNSEDLYSTLILGAEELKNYFTLSNQNLVSILELKNSKLSKNLHIALLAFGIAKGLKNSEALLSPSLLVGCLIQNHNVPSQPFFDETVVKILKLDLKNKSSIIAQVAARFEDLTGAQLLSKKDALKSLLVGGIGDLGLDEMVALQNFLKELALI